MKIFKVKISEKEEREHLERARRNVVSSFYGTARLLQDNPIIHLSYLNKAYLKMSEALNNFSFQEEFNNGNRLVDFVHINNFIKTIFLEQYINDSEESDLYVIDVKQPSLDTTNFSDEELKLTYQSILPYFQ